MLIITKAAMISIPSQKPASGSSLDSGVDCGEMSVLSNRRPANMQPSNMMNSQSTIFDIKILSNFTRSRVLVGGEKSSNSHEICTGRGSHDHQQGYKMFLMNLVEQMKFHGKGYIM